MPAKKYLAHYLYCLIIISLLLVAGFNINHFINSKKVLGASTNITPLIEEKKYWLDIISSSPTYIDAYLQIAKVDVQLGNKEEAANYLQQAYNLNPNSSKIEGVKNELGL